MVGSAFILFLSFLPLPIIINNTYESDEIDSISLLHDNSTNIGRILMF
jgi:hypothetical protein